MKENLRRHMLVAILLLLFEGIVGAGLIGPSVGLIGAIVAGWRAAIWKVERSYLLRVAAVYALLAMASLLVIGWNSDIAHKHAKPVIAVVERFHADHGRYPESLDELVPAYLPSIPRAGFTWWSRWYGYDGLRPQLYFAAMFHGMFFYDFPSKQWLANE